jgi:hypothetical protein
MDLQLILRVLWRFKLIVVIGILLAAALATLSYVKVGTDGKIEYRQTEQWESLATLFVTSRGFPWGSTANRPEDETIPPEKRKVDPNVLDPNNLIGLAALYVRLSTSDPVKKLMERDGPIDGTLSAYPVSSVDSGDGEPLPMLTLSAIATTPEAAQKLAGRHADAFVKYIKGEQERAGLKRVEQVVVKQARAPQKATLLAGRKTTRPMVVFMAVMIAVLGLVFALENLRPRVRALPGQDAAPRDENRVEAIATRSPARQRRRSA